jgi:hypothetical protein
MSTDLFNKKDIFRGTEFIRIHNHVELLKQLEQETPCIDSFHEGYICGFLALVKALEKDLNE